ncbi:MAG: hypothetical protein WCQ57_15070, partial [Verrucomicrobiota bacterium]
MDGDFFKAVLGQDFRDARSLIVADFQREGAAGREASGAPGDESLDDCQSVRAAIEGGEWVQPDFALEGREIAAGDVGEIGDDEVEALRSEVMRVIEER